MRVFGSVVRIFMDDEAASPAGRCLRLGACALCIIPFQIFGPAGRLFLASLLIGISFLIEGRHVGAIAWSSFAWVHRAWTAWSMSHSYALICFTFVALAVGVGIAISRQEERARSESSEWKMP